jgi:hypothetical protein
MEVSSLYVIFFFLIAQTRPLNNGEGFIGRDLNSG